MTADEGWESLGDIGRLDQDGYLYVTDREADMILVDGVNVYPAEVEAALDSHPAVRSSAVIGVPDEEHGNTPLAVVELCAPVSDSELLTHLGGLLAAFKLPSRFDRVDHPLRDPAGKVRRFQLRTRKISELCGEGVESSARSDTTPREGEAESLPSGDPVPVNRSVCRARTTA